jgi:hypothetical protein
MATRQSDSAASTPRRRPRRHQTTAVADHIRHVETIWPGQKLSKKNGEEPNGPSPIDGEFLQFVIRSNNS